MSDVATPTPTTLERDRFMPNGYNWPDGQLAVWKLVTREAWVAAPLEEHPMVPLEGAGPKLKRAKESRRAAVDRYEEIKNGLG